MNWKPIALGALQVAVAAILGIPLVFLFIKVIVEFWQRIGELGGL